MSSKEPAELGRHTSSSNGIMNFAPPFPQGLRRQRQAFSTPSCSAIRTPDSGYGTISPPSPPSPSVALKEFPGFDIDAAKCLSRLGDGNQSEVDDPFGDSDEENALANRFTAALKLVSEVSSRKKTKPATLPRLTRSRSSLPRSFRAVDSAIHLPRRQSNISGARQGAGTLRVPDRFIPLRSTSTDTTERFRVGKAPHELTSTEKILRHNGASEDAFCYRRRVVSPMVADTNAHPVPDGAPRRHRAGTVLSTLDNQDTEGPVRQVSHGTVWGVGGVAPSTTGGSAVDNGRGQLVRTGTNARLFRTTFPAAKPKAEEELEKHGARIATALGLDRAQRVLRTNLLRCDVDTNAECTRPRERRTDFDGVMWVKESPVQNHQKAAEAKELPAAPFKVLDAPHLRDDFYCSILAYSATCRTLAMGLGNVLYGWSESSGVRQLNAAPPTRYEDDHHLTSIAFSSAEGSKAILAFGRSDGTLGLMSLFDDIEDSSTSASILPRFQVVHPSAIACLSWRPTCAVRPSKSIINPGTPVRTEDLLVGDNIGSVFYYIVEWPERWEVERDNWAGHMTLVAKITVHSQQICGLSWSKDGELLATGGNDNLCCLFEAKEVLRARSRAPGAPLDGQDWGITPRSEGNERAATDAHPQVLVPQVYNVYEVQVLVPQIYNVYEVLKGMEKHRWEHKAAVKAIAFCPWQDGLLATGGGSNDKCIHFFHTTTGAPLATISVSAQVTSLIWSTTRREIAATFGYAQPDHSVRIAVFSWPDCRQVAAIPWPSEHRALYAIPYPGGPGDASVGRGGARRGHSRTAMEGCIMVASSDSSVKFHEVWSSNKKATAGGSGMLGGSDILESLQGIEREGNVIR